MMDWVSQLILWLNVPANALGRVLLAPVASVPGWLSNTVVSAVTGIAILVAFKYTSNQTAIARTKNHIKANLLAIKLFKDSVRVAVRAEAQILKGASCLLFFSLRPMAVLIVPMALLLAQMGLWYQLRPLQLEEEAVITVELHDSVDPLQSPVILKPTSAIDVVLGPVRVTSRGEVCWAVKAREPGCHELVFSANGAEITKALAVGPGFMRVSAVRPGRNWAHILQHPAEPPLAADSAVQSIRIDYPERASWVAGSNSWVIFFFVAATVVAFMAAPCLKVKF